ncbi:binding-protein-dependent transport system inner membrane component [Micromonospora sp. ATCC 39149]|uniref:Sugar ABC transporter permease n=1 Tax=Micromonospora carbonacea TaxID=47853 RepID=A0A7D6GHW3_9ACTN|nr:sugar ABC transporter permease [Micromonospora sp. ATCC 39149]EEP70518.1 binding-protein-dependent transport system inner membrane component [Micromonospora sp. ATCC 39149]QLK01527.1 sugar ABC transporter permease [Micromonospora carbonacea]
MLAPYLAGLVGLVLLPALVTLALAFTHYDLVRPPAWAGFDNFTALVEDPIFRIALTNTVVFAVVAVPLRVLLALGLALLLHRRTPGAGTARAAALLPTAVPEIAYGLLWLWLLNPLYGPINQVLRVGGENGLTALGRTPPQWLTDPTDARAAIILVSLFTMGETFVVLLAARRALPRDVYEMAAIEDATGWDVFRRITLPLMAPVLALLALRDAIASLHFTFVSAFVVTDGGPPPYATTYLSLFVYQTGFEYLRYGYAAAATLVMMVLTLAAVLVQWRLVRRYRRFYPR